MRTAFGVVLSAIGVAFVSCVPGLQWVGLGYLLSASGRVAQTGSVRSGFVAAAEPRRVAAACLGALIWIVPALLVARIWRSLPLVDAGLGAWYGYSALLAALALIGALQIAAALSAGGRFRDFLIPRFTPRRIADLFRACASRQSFDRARSAVQALRLPESFALSMKCALASLIWLMPAAALMSARQVPWLVAVGLAWCLLAAIYLPFAQARFAAERRFAALFQLRTVHGLFRRAPLSFLAASSATLLLAVPLYLFLFEPAPQRVAWMPTTLFLLLLLPGRLLAARAIHRAASRPRRALLPLRWLCGVAIIVVAAFYVFLLAFAPLFTWNGSATLINQPALLLPLPLSGLLLSLR